MRHIKKFNESYSIHDQIILSCADLLDHFDYKINLENGYLQIHFYTNEVVSPVDQSQPFGEQQIKWSQIVKDKKFVVRVPGIKSDHSNLGIFLGDGSKRCSPSTEKEVVNKLGDKGFLLAQLLDSCVKLLHTISPFSYLGDFKNKYKYSDLLFYTEIKREPDTSGHESIVLYYQVSIILSNSLSRYGTSYYSYYGED